MLAVCLVTTTNAFVQFFFWMTVSRVGARDTWGVSAESLDYSHVSPINFGYNREPLRGTLSLEAVNRGDARGLPVEQGIFLAFLQHTGLRFIYLTTFFYSGVIKAAWIHNW
ncbi:hypothetical protein FKM82_018406 [Ascaphus truei]